MAASEFEEAISTNTLSKVALRNCANAYLGLENPQSNGHVSTDSPNTSKAEEYYRRAIQLDPTDYLSIFLYADLLYRLGCTDRAEIFLLKALSLNPNDYRSLYKYYNIRSGRGSPEEKAHFVRRIDAAMKSANSSRECAWNERSVRLVALDNDPDALHLYLNNPIWTRQTLALKPWAFIGPPETEKVTFEVVIPPRPHLAELTEMSSANRHLQTDIYSLAIGIASYSPILPLDREAFPGLTSQSVAILFRSDDLRLELYHNGEFECSLPPIDATIDLELDKKRGKLKFSYTTIEGAKTQKNCKELITADQRHQIYKDVFDWRFVISIIDECSIVRIKRKIL